MNNLFSLEGKKALVSGAGRGIGQGIAAALARQGADVALASRSEAELEQTASLVRAAGTRAVVLPVDLRQPDAPAQLVEAAVSALGGLDILVTSSGTIVRKPALEMTDADWETVIGLNLKARFFLAKAAAESMLRQGGSIIHIASLSNFFGVPNQASYVTGNGGIGAMTRAQAIEWAPYGIRVNAIAPGTIVTGQTLGLLSNPEVRASRLAKIPLNRLGEPEDCAGAAVFLASQAASYVTGHILVVDGGWLAAGGGLKG
ncbi:MAG: SDR family oxidoreductase [Anaerolineae bacterium]|nr:SDR family oxidoreductase [Anaerolineae bacterium]NUQ04572.1 SDR family oxidoreductase [Anaerolineae bacterium]